MTPWARPRKARDRLARRLTALLKHTREYKRLYGIPGVGEVVAPIFVAVIDTPWRFATKRRLWSYAGRGLRRRWSGDPRQAREGGACSGNRLLKYGAMIAAQNAIKGNGAKGQKAHTWLTRAEVVTLLDTCGDDLKGRRDRLALGLLVAAGLRRAEAVALAFDDVKLQPVQGKVRTLLDVEGQGAKHRVVPVSDDD